MKTIKAAATRSKNKHQTDEGYKASLLKLLTVSSALNISNDDSIFNTLKDKLNKLEATFNSIPQGICLFNAEKRLVLANHRYSEIYRLDPSDIVPGISLRDIAEYRIAVGTCPTGVEALLKINETINAKDGLITRVVDIGDGRTIQICHHALPDGGWVATHEDITELKSTRAIGGQTISLQTLIDWLPDHIWIKDTQGRFVVLNRALAAGTEYLHTTDIIGLSAEDLVDPQRARVIRDRERAILRTGEPQFELEETVTDANGAQRWISSTKIPLRNERDEIYGIVGISRDITERKRAEILSEGQAKILEMIAMRAHLEDVLLHLMQLIESQLSGIYCSTLLLDADGAHLRHGAAPSLPEAYLRAIDGVAIGDNVGSCGTAVFRRRPIIVTDIMSDPLWQDFRDLAKTYGLRSCWSTPILSHQGTVLGTFALYSKTVRAPTDTELNLVNIGIRLTGIAIERKLAEDRIHFMAHHDPLTGLPNRALLKDRLAQALLHAQAGAHWVSVIFIDFDNFKVINDSLGHNAGDDLLRIAAGRMVACVGPTNTVVRFGGDEFVILLMDQPCNADAVTEKADAIRRALGESIVIKGHDLHITCSMGISNYPDDGADVDALIANADAAMYRAKENGRDNYQFYTPDLNTRAQARFLLLEALKVAVERGEFTLHYQPQIELAGNAIFAAEALVRWNHPEFGLVSPCGFIPLAEETGLIVPIGEWVLQEACRQNKAWQDAGLPKIRVCVNVSARQFTERGLVSQVVAALGATGLEARYLELELTESLIMRDLPQAIRMMEQLQALGVSLAIDDFGTGYSSLSALKSFPVARLKIDKSFIADLATNENDRAVASAVISLGQKLKLKVIAEGVETEAQVAFLRENHCDEIQGYYVCRPVTAEAFEQLLTDRRA